MGDQIRGFGFTHDGSIDTPVRFLTTVLFRFVPPAGGDPGNPGGFASDRAQGDADRQSVEDFLFAYDNNLAPIVGQQVTMSRATWLHAQPRIDLLEARARAGDCDLVARASSARGYLYVPATGRFRPNRATAPALGDAAFRLLAGLLGVPVTFTCVPPGEGVRVALDHDLDGVLDGDEPGAGSDLSAP
jgi:hypothetical protein